MYDIDIPKINKEGLFNLNLSPSLKLLTKKNEFLITFKIDRINKNKNILLRMSIIILIIFILLLYLFFSIQKPQFL